MRGQTLEDRRPNKALYPRRYEVLLQGNRHQQLLQSIASEGISPRWLQRDPHECIPPANHQSANRHLGAVLSSITKGQAAGQYLLLDDDIAASLHGIHFSPLGAVPKKDMDPSIEVRLIHDLAYPRGKSANDASNSTSFPGTQFKSVATIARRIDECTAAHPGVLVCIMKGDVKSSFRHLMLVSEAVRWMGGRLPQCDALVVEMSAPFGWFGSPPYYVVFGGAIAPVHSVGELSPIQSRSFLTNGWMIMSS